MLCHPVSVSEPPLVHCCLQARDVAAPMLNYAPCTNDYEQSFAKFLDGAENIIA